MSQARGTFGPKLLPRAAVGGVVLALMCAALPAGAFAQAAAPVTVQRVNVVEEAGAVEIGIEATGPIGYRTMVLDDPVRYVIDLPAAKNGTGRPTQRVGVGALQTVRVGQVTDTPPVTRVVLDLSQAVQWSVRRPSTQVVVVRLVVPEAHGPTVSPWSSGSAVSTAETGSGTTTGGAGSAAPAPERPWGARVDAGLPPAPGAQASAGGRPSADSVRAGPPAGVPGIVVAQQSSGTGRLLTLDLRDAQLGDVLDALARLCSLNVVTDASVSGARVTVHLVGVTCEQALNFVLDANGLGYRRVGETLVIQPIARLTPPPPGPVMRVYRLQYVQ